MVAVVDADVVDIDPAIPFWPSTLKVPARVSVTAALAPCAMLLVTVMVATVAEVCSTVMPVTFALNVKSSPFTVLMVEASIVPEVALTLKMLVLVVLEAEFAVSVNAGVLTSTIIEPLTFRIEVAGSPLAWLPYSTV